jgi:hypothetical protein
MATLADVVKYLKSGAQGRPLPLDEVKKLSAEERAELVASLETLTPEELAR